MEASQKMLIFELFWDDTQQTFILVHVNDKSYHLAKDPVCGMNVQENTPFVGEYEGEKYYLCSEGCKTTFEKNPQKYK